MKKPKPTGAINTYNTEGFRHKYMQQGQKLNTMLKPGIDEFFIVHVQDLIRLIKLPVPPMRATSHTFIFLTGGDATMSIGSETYTIYKNECLFVPAGQVFSFKNVDKNKGYLCNFNNSFLTGKFGVRNAEKEFEFLNVWGNPQVKLSKQTAVHVLQLFKHLYATYTESGLSNPAILQANFLSVLFQVQNAYQPLPANNQPGQPVMLSNRFKQLLFENIRKKNRVADYATLLSVTPNHLNKVVKKVTGKSPTTWIDETLILEAKILLHQTGYTIAQVADAIGLNDPSYFSRMFKKHEGVTPQQFRTPKSPKGDL